MVSGSGTNLKKLDYMKRSNSHRQHPIGARGLEIENGKHALTAVQKNRSH
jgi:hypothetical protein